MILNQPIDNDDELITVNAIVVDRHTLASKLTREALTENNPAMLQAMTLGLISLGLLRVKHHLVLPASMADHATEAMLEAWPLPATDVATMLKLIELADTLFDVGIVSGAIEAVEEPGFEGKA
jgi:hypothetical protein